MAPQSVARWAPRKRGSGSGGDARARQSIHGAPAARYGVASSSGRNCSALRGRTIRIVAFRASHPANPPPRQRRFIQRFPKRRISVQENLMQRDSESSGNALPDIAKRLLNLIDKNQA